jgi:hypothetical protein
MTKCPVLCNSQSITYDVCGLKSAFLTLSVGEPTLIIYGIYIYILFLFGKTLDKILSSFKNLQTDGIFQQDWPGPPTLVPPGTTLPYLSFPFS